jgi:hypothetical protein
MSDEHFVPKNALETALLDAKHGQTSIFNFLKMLVESDVYMLSSTEVNSDGTGFRPLLFDRGGDTMMSVFTARERASAFADEVPYCLTMKGHELLQRIPTGFGIVINPGIEVGMEIPSSGIGDIRHDFMTQR